MFHCFSLQNSLSSSLLWFLWADLTLFFFFFLSWDEEFASSLQYHNILHRTTAKSLDLSNGIKELEKRPKTWKVDVEHHSCFPWVHSLAINCCCIFIMITIMITRCTQRCAGSIFSVDKEEEDSERMLLLFFHRHLANKWCCCWPEIWCCDLTLFLLRCRFSCCYYYGCSITNCLSTKISSLISCPRKELSSWSPSSEWFRELFCQHSFSKDYQRPLCVLIALLASMISVVASVFDITKYCSIWICISLLHRIIFARSVHIHFGIEKSWWCRSWCSGTGSLRNPAKL